MNFTPRVTLTLLLALTPLITSPVLAQGSSPQIQPLGAVQPIAPGYQKLPPLPRLQLTPTIPEVYSVEYLSNGFLEAAHALVLLERARVTLEKLLTLAQQAAERSFAARANLNEVDVSVYQKEGYFGIGGPLPLLTASVPRARLSEFLALTPQTLDRYDRLWDNPSLPQAPEQPASGDTDAEQPEAAPQFQGTPAELRALQLRQKAAQRTGRVVGGTLFHGDPRFPVAALTFDDAVHPLYAPLILDALRRTGAKATFFVVGRNVEAYPYFARDLVKEGHELANHTYHHVRITELSPAVLRDELTRTNTLITSLTGQSVRYFRPPGGRFSSATLKTVRSLGLTVAFWTDDPADFNNPGPQVIETRFTRFLRPGGILLLHDNARQTAQTLPDLINDAWDKGLRLVALRDLPTR